MEKELLVTIAIPIYNAELYLADTIQSVINQSYQNWELLLMEDGSKDNSMEIARRYSLYDQRIKLISDGCNRGLVYRLNESISMAKGVFYARMDADDIMAVDRIKKEVEEFIKKPHLDVCGCSGMLIDQHNNIVGSQNMAGVTDMFMHPTVMGRTEWFKKNKYSEWAKRIEDRDLWYRTLPYSVFYNIPEPLFFYRAFGTPSSTQFFASNKRQRKLFRRYKEYNRPISWCIKNIIVTYLKDIIAFVLYVFRLDSILQSIRGRNSVPENIALTERDLNASISRNWLCI